MHLGCRADRVSSGVSMRRRRRAKAGDVGVNGATHWVSGAEFWFADDPCVLIFGDQSCAGFRRWLYGWDQGVRRAAWA